VPAIPSWLLEPLWDQFAALLPDRPVYHPAHPLGCHKPRIADRIIFEKLIQVLRFGCSYVSIADCACGATTIRDRRDEWIKAGIFANLKIIARESYDRIVGLALADIAVDGCLTKAPGGGDCAGPSPVDRRVGEPPGKTTMITHLSARGLTSRGPPARARSYAGAVSCCSCLARLPACSRRRPDCGISLTGVPGQQGWIRAVLHDPVTALSAKHSNFGDPNDSGSQTGSQRPQLPGHARPYPAIATTIKQHVRRYSALPSHTSKAPPKQ
jgi:transposase